MGRILACRKERRRNFACIRVIPALGKGRCLRESAKVTVHKGARLERGCRTGNFGEEPFNVLLPVEKDILQAEKPHDVEGGVVDYGLPGDHVAVVGAHPEAAQHDLDLLLHVLLQGKCGSKPGRSR